MKKKFFYTQLALPLGGKVVCASEPVHLQNTLIPFKESVTKEVSDGGIMCVISSFAHHSQVRESEFTTKSCLYFTTTKNELINLLFTLLMWLNTKEF